MSHFIYTRKVRKQIENTEGTPEAKYTEIELKESFNLDKVIRSVMKDTETLVVLLHDGHEETIEIVPERRDPKGKLIQESVKKRLFLASEIELKGEDIDRFFDIIK